MMMPPLPNTPACPLADGRVQQLGAIAEGRRFINSLCGKPLFTCTVASTETAAIEGISAAGATAEKRRYTAALDSEVLVHGAPRSLDEIPINPAGPPSPVVITRAALQLLDCEALIIDAGCEIAPKTPRLILDGTPGRCIRTAQALTLTRDFIDNCRHSGRLLAAQAPWLILAESVPGGTTTALALLEGLGFNAQGRVSSSMPGGNHPLKAQVVAQALKAADFKGQASALQIAAAIGDPMQPAVALMALEASKQVPVVLGGGTQMAAVAALIQRLYQQGAEGNLENIGLATTAWVADDPTADLAGILAQLPFPMAAFYANLNFAQSSLPGLRRYQEGLVKEGVGAGAAAFAAFVDGDIKHDQLLREIEAVTWELCAS